jgi:hypothetical protein
MWGSSVRALPIGGLQAHGTQYKSNDQDLCLALEGDVKGTP